MSRGDHRALMLHETHDKEDKPDFQEIRSHCTSRYYACKLCKGRYWNEVPSESSGIAAIHLLNPGQLGKPPQASDFMSM